MARQDDRKRLGQHQRARFLRTIGYGLLVLVASVLTMAPFSAVAQDVTLVSKANLSGDVADGESVLFHPSFAGKVRGQISADGRYVVFISTATNLVPGQVDTNDATDVFMYDRVTGTTTLVSHLPGAPESTGNNQSVFPVISADGAFVAFVSDATDLVAGTDVNAGTPSTFSSTSGPRAR